MPDDPSETPAPPPAVQGRTLSDAVAARQAGLPVETIADAAACALCFIRVCDALHAAHLRGVLHGALRPEAILLGQDGQVGISGWPEDERKPLTARYCARPTATLPADGRHDDIRAIGACLFTALVGEAPSQDGAGGLGEIDIAVRSRVPGALLWVIRKAMSSTAADGYASVADMRADLLRYLAGRLVQREMPGLLARLRTSIAVHARLLVVITLLLVGLTALAMARNWWSVRTYATWGLPLVATDFSGSAWKSDWVQRGRWEYREGRIVSQSERECALILKRRLVPPVAIEYTGRFSATVRAGDLSVWWCEDDAPGMAPGDSIDRTNSWFVQAGAHDNSWCTIWQTPAQLRAQVNSLVLQPDRDYRFRVEIESDRLRMWIDGQQVLEHRELIPIASGNIALYTYDPGKAFTDVRIWQQEVPSLISPLAIGDDAYRSGRFTDAVAAYARVASSHRGTPLGDEALFFQGLPLHRLGMRRLAAKAWLQLPDGLLRHRADTLELDNLLSDGDLAGAVERFTAMWRERPGVHDILRQRWQVCGQRLCQSPVQASALEAWIALRDACFPEDQASRWLVADMLHRLGRWPDILDRFPDEYRAAAQALLALGRNAELLAAPWATASERAAAMIDMGDVDVALRLPDLEPHVRATLLCKTGRAEQALAYGLFPAAIYLDRVDELLDTVNPGSALATCSQIAIGRVADVADLRIDGKPCKNSGWALSLLGRLDEAEKLGADVRLFRLFEHLAAGDLEVARELREAVGNQLAANRNAWFARGPGLALVDEELGQVGALRTALRHGAATVGAWGNRQAVVCAAALDHRQEQAVVDMPWRTEAAAWLLLAQALRAELAGDRPAASAGWRAYLALPPLQRLIAEHFPAADVEAIARWRITALERRP